MKCSADYEDQRAQHFEGKSNETRRGSRELRAYARNRAGRGNRFHHHENFSALTGLGGRQDCFRSHQGVERNDRG